MFKLSRNRILYLITYLTDFSLFMVIFTVSRDLAEMDTGIFKMGIVGGGCSLAYAISSMIFGSLSDRWGRRRVIITGLILALLTGSGCLLLKPHMQIYFWVYWGFSGSFGLVYPPLIAWLNQEQGAHGQAHLIQRTLIRFCFSWNLGLISGQLFGGFLFSFGRQWPLYFSMLLILAKMALMIFPGKWFHYRPGRDEQDTDTIEVEAQEVARSFTTLSWLSNIGGAFSITMIIHLFPALAVALAIPSEAHGSILASMRVTVLLTYYFLYRTKFWHYRYVYSIVVQVAGITGLVFIIIAESHWALIAGMSGVALFTGYNYFSGLYYSSASRSDANRGFACGMHEATIGLGFAGGAIGGGAVGHFAGVRSPYQLGILVILLLMLTQFVIYLRQIKPRQSKRSLTHE